MIDTPMKRCGAVLSNSTKKPGTPCSNPNLQWFEGHGWRCPFHLPAGATWTLSSRKAPRDPAPEPGPMPNEGRLDSYEDALAMIRWATAEVAAGRLTESRARGTINGAARYIMILTDKDRDTRLKALEDAWDVKKHARAQ